MKSFSSRLSVTVTARAVGPAVKAAIRDYVGTQRNTKYRYFFIVRGEQTFTSLQVPMEQWNIRTNRATCDVERGANISYETEGTGGTARVAELPVGPLTLPEEAAVCGDFNAADMLMAVPLTSWH
jgi:hypothetical protein